MASHATMGGEGWLEHCVPDQNAEVQLCTPIHLGAELAEARACRSAIAYHCAGAGTEYSRRPPSVHAVPAVRQTRPSASRSLGVLAQSFISSSWTSSCVLTNGYRPVKMSWKWRLMLMSTLREHTAAMYIATSQCLG